MGMCTGMAGIITRRAIEIAKVHSEWLIDRAQNRALPGVQLHSPLLPFTRCLVDKAHQFDMPARVAE